MSIDLADPAPLARTRVHQGFAWGWLLRRIGGALLTILLAGVVVFLGARALPGDAITANTGAEVGSLSVQEQARMRAELGLDQPVPVQFVKYLGRMVTGDFGVSTRNGLDVGQTILERMQVTVQLALVSIVVAVLLGTAAGTYAALHRRRTGDLVVNAAAMVAMSVPGFWLGLMMIMFLALRLEWLPASGFVPFAEDPIGNIRSLVMPVIVLALPLSAVLARQVRSSMVEALQSDFIRTARAKGMLRRQVIWRHALRSCLTPLLTMTGLQLGALITGSLIVERLFVLPGLGSTLVDAVGFRDYPTIQAVALVMAVGYVLINLIVDVLYSVVDPRIRSGAQT